MGGKPKPEVQWFKNDNPVVHRVLADGSLYIEKTELTDSGKYTARVTNQAGQSEATVHITVSQPSPPEGLKFIINLQLCRPQIYHRCCFNIKLVPTCFGEFLLQVILDIVQFEWKTLLDTWH